ncbi:exopolysaccharide production repressor protein [Sinorhizobium psoraleae]|uniref:Exopolysaccharide repressor protein n=1 Tax=Sinorhizobium psoraleae TaxID=520838 RepID=A0ABT4KMT0_9HYPH|nr:exopolysaccharide production repressor protein [Sinorhizobium psoraleae]MCZ4093159.1 hypothetical protein [Sinorhizobium psoraleae]
MPFRIFRRVLQLVLCANALRVYLISHSIRRVIIATLGTALLLQVAYFASVLFLVWRAWCNRRAVEGTSQRRRGSDYS